MAIYHYQMKTISRSEGRTATASVAYRSGEKIHDIRTGLTFDYSKRSGVMLAEVITPDGNKVNREALWNAVELAEKRKNSVVAREIVVAIPHELSQPEQMKLVKAYAQGLAERTGWGVDLAIHHPGREGDMRNVHAHLVCTTRSVSRDGAGCPVMGSKTREWDQRATGSELIRSERSEWERCINQALEKAQIQSRVDCRSHAEKGTGLEPKVHLGPAASQMERDGIQSERGNLNRAIEAHNGRIIELAEVRQAKDVEKAFEAELLAMQGMALDELEAMRVRYHPRGSQALIEQSPQVVAEKARLQSLQDEQAQLEQRLNFVQKQAQEASNQEEYYRASHPWKAIWHDASILPDNRLWDLEQATKGYQHRIAEVEGALTAFQAIDWEDQDALMRFREAATEEAHAEDRRQWNRYNAVYATYCRYKPLRYAEAEVLEVQQVSAEMKRLGGMSETQLEALARHCAFHQAHSIVNEDPMVQAWQGKIQENGLQQRATVETLELAKKTLELAQAQEAAWVKAHPVQAFLSKGVELPDPVRLAVVRNRLEAERDVVQSEIALMRLVDEEKALHKELNAAIQLVQPEAEKEAKTRKRQYAIANTLLEPVRERQREEAKRQEAFLQQQREARLMLEQRQKEQELLLKQEQALKVQQEIEQQLQRERENRERGHGRGFSR